MGKLSDWWAKIAARPGIDGRRALVTQLLEEITNTLVPIEIINTRKMTECSCFITYLVLI